MFFYTKIVIVCTIFTTAWLGYSVDCSTPYFPIEISRTATGRYGRIFFPVGAGIALATALFETQHVWTLLPFVGLVVLTLVTDEMSWPIHMIGVYAMIGSIAYVCHTAGNDTWYPFIGLMSLFLFRVLLKVVWTSLQGQVFLFQRIQTLMLTGDFTSRSQKMAFQVAGVLQWVVLIGMMLLYDQALDRIFFNEI